jgi:hypothetical protein
LIKKRQKFVFYKISLFYKNINIMIPEELQQKPPRDIDYAGNLFIKNRKKAKNLMLGSLLAIPLVGLIFWLKFGDFLPGLMWGAGITALGELMGFALMVNAKKAVELCKNGLVAIGTVQKSTITGNRGRYTSKDSAGYIFVDVLYKSDWGHQFRGKAAYIGASKEIDLKEGDEVPVLYSQKFPDKFLIYSTSLGMSAMGKSKKV